MPPLKPTCYRLMRYAFTAPILRHATPLFEPDEPAMPGIPPPGAAENSRHQPWFATRPARRLKAIRHHRTSAWLIDFNTHAPLPQNVHSLAAAAMQMRAHDRP